MYFWLLLLMTAFVLQGHIFIYNINYININICKYLKNICCVSVYLYIHNIYIQYTHTYYVNKTFNLNAINHDYSFDHTIFYEGTIFAPYMPP